jgi:glycosyltransferase involved in cell wall biosynthesis
MRCDIIIPVWDQPSFTKECVDSVARNTEYPHRLIIVDNGSGPETRDYLKGLSAKGAGATLIRNEENLGFVKAANQGLRASDAPYVCLLNNDTVASPGWLERLVAFAEEHEDVGLMNPVCDGHLDTPIDEYAGRLRANRGRYMEMNQCFGFCMLIKREVIDKIGYLDEAFGLGGFDDTDYSMRAHIAGYRSVCVHDSYVYHRQHVTFGAMGDRKKLVAPGEKAYFEKWPRHLRVGVGFGLDDKTGEGSIERLLRDILFLARQWCWVNLWIFGDRKRSGARIAEASKRIGMPLHQNIKISYMPRQFAGVQTLVRLLERSFGTKARKRYDAVLVPDRATAALLRAFGPVHRTDVRVAAFSCDTRPDLERMVADARRRRR